MPTYVSLLIPSTIVRHDMWYTVRRWPATEAFLGNPSSLQAWTGSAGHASDQSRTTHTTTHNPSFDLLPDCSGIDTSFAIFFCFLSSVNVL